jgi:NAD(P)-dependent dehydrogenase (short-subunit alcohol dehydrogenase family)
MDIKGSSIVVTGGASGLGAATVEMIVAQGGKVVIADMNEELGLALAERLGDAAKFTLCDVSNEEHAQKTIDLAISEFGGIHGVVNCAGIAIGEKNSRQKRTSSTRYILKSDKHQPCRHLQYDSCGC